MKIKLLDHLELKAFLPGSGLEWYNDQLYIVGDDATDLMVLDKRWKPRNIIPLLHGEEQAERPSRYMSATIVEGRFSPRLFLAGTGLGAAPDNTGLLMDLQTRATEEVDLQPFYNRVKASGLPQLSVQAIAAVNDYIIFGHYDNQFVITTDACWKDPHGAELIVRPLELPLKKDEQIALTGLAYSPMHECLLFTAASKTGAGSYLGLIENALRKIGRNKMKVNDLISMQDEEKALKGYRIQALCIQSEKKSGWRVQLSARDNAGGSHLLKMRVKF